jgi:DNA repair protein RadC
MQYGSETGSVRLRDLPEGLRPREEMERVGVRNMSDVSLLAILLQSGARGVNVLELATRLLRKYGSLEKMLSASVEELAADREIKGLGRVKAQKVLAALEIGRRVQSALDPAPVRVRSPEDVVRLLRDRVRELDREVFWVLRLDAKNNLKGQPEPVSEGILDASLVHPREVFKVAVRTSAAAVVVAHNHPSGEPTPSAEDLRVTRQLVEAGRIVDIRVLDHIILGRPSQEGRCEYVSMREENLVAFGDA